MYILEECMQPTPVFLPGESRGQRSLAGYRVTKSQTRLNRLRIHTHKYIHIIHTYIHTYMSAKELMLSNCDAGENY